MKDILIAAPDGQAGGGMGRVKDYVLQTPPDAASQYRFVPLVTRDGRGALFSLLLLFAGIGRIWWGALRRSVALLHVNMGDRGSLARKGVLLMAARAAGLPAVLHLHAAELEQFYEQAGPLTRWFLRRPFLAATCVVVLGERYRRWLVATLGIDAAKIRILHNGVAAAPRPARNADVETVQTLLFLGNLIERKGVSDLLHALGMLPPDTAPWRAVLVGGGDIDLYRTLAHELGLGGKVLFPGWADRAEAGRLLGEASGLILPSYDEGLPLVILEAMGMGLPVICTPVGVIAEVLVDGDTALFVEAGDRAGLARCIHRLLADRALQAGLSHRASALFERGFSLGAFQDALLAIYRDCCGVDYVPEHPVAGRGG